MACCALEHMQGSGASSIASEEKSSGKGIAGQAPAGCLGREEPVGLDCGCVAPWELLGVLLLP